MSEICRRRKDQLLPEPVTDVFESMATAQRQCPPWLPKEYHQCPSPISSGARHQCLSPTPCRCQQGSPAMTWWHYQCSPAALLQVHHLYSQEYPSVSIPEASLGILIDALKHQDCVVFVHHSMSTGLPRWCSFMVKNPPANAGGIRDMGLVPRWRSSPGGGRGNPLQCSCLENPMDRGAWRAAVYRVAKSWTGLM